MNLPQSYIPHYTYTDYVQWEGRWELICGVPHAYNPFSDFRHQYLLTNILVELNSGLKSLNSVSIVSAIDFVPKEDVVLCPDVCVFCSPVHEEQRITQVPEIIVELVSERTEIVDRSPKYDLYQQFGVSYYLIIQKEPQPIDAFELRETRYHPLVPQANQKFRLNLPVGTVEIDFSPIWN